MEDSSPDSGGNTSPQSSPSARPDNRRANGSRSSYNNLATIRANASNTDRPGNRPAHRRDGGMRQLSNNLSSSMVVDDSRTNRNPAQTGRDFESFLTAPRLGQGQGNSSVIGARCRRRRIPNNDTSAAQSTTPLWSETIVRNTSPTRQNPFRGSRRNRGVPRVQGQRERDNRREEQIDNNFGASLFPSLINQDPSQSLSNSFLIPSSLQLDSEASAEGTIDDPILLSPDSSPDDNPEAGVSDEELARRLQMEEWQSVGADHIDPWTTIDMSTPDMDSRLNMLPRRFRGSRIPPGGRGGATASDHNSRPRRVPRRFAAVSSPADLLPNIPLTFSGDQEEVSDGPDFSFILDMLRSSRMLELMQARTFLQDSDTEDYEQLLALGEQIGEVNKGLTQAEINKIPTRKHRSIPSPGAEGGSQSDDMKCNICLTDYEDGDRKRVLPCQHEFHPECIDTWLKSNPTCPVCRHDVKTKVRS